MILLQLCLVEFGQVNTPGKSAAIKMFVYPVCPDFPLLSSLSHGWSSRQPWILVGKTLVWVSLVFLRSCFACFLFNLFTYWQILDFLLFEAILNMSAVHIVSPCVELSFPLSSETLSESCFYLSLVYSTPTPETGSPYVVLAVLELTDMHLPLCLGLKTSATISGLSIPFFLSICVRDTAEPNGCYNLVTWYFCLNWHFMSHIQEWTFRSLYKFFPKAIPPLLAPYSLQELTFSLLRSWGPSTNACMCICIRQSSHANF